MLVETDVVRGRTLTSWPSLRHRWCANLAYTGDEFFDEGIKETRLVAKMLDNRRKAVQLMDQKVTRGSGGEIHQVAENGVPQLTTQQGVPVADDQNSLKIGNRGPAALEDFHLREKIFTTASKYVDFPFKAKSSAMKMLRPRSDRVNLRFVFERMQLIDFSLGNHKRHWISEYQDLEVEVPEPEEQAAIASVATDMDAENAALEARREKAQALKQGMMQQLLTGDIRLI
jgi:hypothetical protein